MINLKYIICQNFRALGWPCEQILFWVPVKTNDNGPQINSQTECHDMGDINWAPPDLQKRHHKSGLCGGKEENEKERKIACLIHP